APEGALESHCRLWLYAACFRRSAKPSSPRPRTSAPSRVLPAAEMVGMLRISAVQLRVNVAPFGKSGSFVAQFSVPPKLSPGLDGVVQLTLMFWVAPGARPPELPFPMVKPATPPQSNVSGAVPVLVTTIWPAVKVAGGPDSGRLPPGSGEPPQLAAAAGVL